jgi:hypothetical protein
MCPQAGLGLFSVRSTALKIAQCPEQAHNINEHEFSSAKTSVHKGLCRFAQKIKINQDALNLPQQDPAQPWETQSPVDLGAPDRMSPL